MNEGMKQENCRSLAIRTGGIVNLKFWDIDKGHPVKESFLDWVYQTEGKVDSNRK